MIKTRDELMEELEKAEVSYNEAVRAFENYKPPRIGDEGYVKPTLKEVLDRNSDLCWRKVASRRSSDLLSGIRVTFESIDFYNKQTKDTAFRMVDELIKREIS